MPFDNSCISGNDARNAINAFLFSETISAPLTAFFTITWKLAQDFDEAALNRSVGTVQHRFARWCRQNDIPCAYIRTVERSTQLGIHTHFLLHVTADLFEPLIEKFPHWIEGYEPNKWIVHFGNERNDPKPKFHRHVNQRKGRLYYMLKGIDQKGRTDVGGLLVRIAELLGIHDKKGPQGRVFCKRVGIAHLLGPVNRQRGGYSDIQEFENLNVEISAGWRGDAK